MNTMSATISTEHKTGMNTLGAVPTIKADDIHLLTGVHDARSKLGLKGKGIKIAVIDTGVYYKHPALGGCFGPGCRISFGYDLVGDHYPQSLILNADPFDNCSDVSHGTHVMGIIMGNATGLKDGGLDFTGVAPEATMGMYRVFSCIGSTANDIVISAIFKAAQDQAHIISLSMGFYHTYPDDPLTVFSSRVSAAGHIVIYSGGNSGDVGLFTTATPANGASVLSVASFDSSYEYTSIAVVTVNGVPYPFTYSFNNDLFSLPDTLNVAVNNLTAYPLSLNDACDLGTINQATAPGQTLLIYYNGGCGSRTSCKNAATKGYAKCLLYSNDDLPIFFGGSILIPSASTNKDGGNAVVSIIRAGNKPTVIVQGYTQLNPQLTSGTVSYFSGAGLDYELNIKPDVGAIGGKVLSTISAFAKKAQHLPYPYVSLSGTSMSAPYAAGCIALLLQAYGGGKSLNFTQIKTLIQNSAKPVKMYGSSMTDSVVNQGAGLINIYDAIRSKVYVYPSNLALNDTQYTKKSYKLKITNKDTTPVVYYLSSVGAATAYPVKAGDDAIQLNTKYTAEYAKVVFKNSYGLVVNSVTVPAGSTATIKVEFTPPATAVASLFPIYSGYISISSNSVVRAKVPYAGMLGKFSDFPIWSRQSASFSDNFLPAATTGLFDITTDAPIASNAIVSSTTGINILPIFETGCRYIKTELLSGVSPNYVVEGFVMLTSNSFFGTLEGANPPRNTYVDDLNHGTGSSPTLYAWNGYVCQLADCSGTGKKLLSPGYYRIKFSALKHFTPVNSKLDYDYDIVITPAFVLDTTASPSVSPSISLSPTFSPSIKPVRAPTYKPKEQEEKPVRVPTYKPNGNGEKEKEKPHGVPTKENGDKEKPSSKHSSTTGLQSSSSIDGSTTDVATIAGVSVAVSVLLLLVIAYFCFYRNKIASRINSGMLKSSTLGQEDIKMDDLFSPEESVDEGTERFSQINFISKF